MMKLLQLLIMLSPLLLTLAACQPAMLPRIVVPEVADETAAMNNPTRLPQAAATSLDQYRDNEYAKLLALAFLSWDPLYQQVTVPKLLLGKTPANLPFVLEPPAETVLVGSITWQEEIGGRIFFTTTLAPQVAVDSFKAILLEQGLVDMSQGWEPSEVFAPSLNLPPRFSACNQAKTFVVWVLAMPLTDRIASVSLTMDSSGPNGPCHAMDADPNHGASRGPLPPLTAPAGVVMQEQGGSMGYNSVWNTTELDTLLSITELAALYNQQLLDAGWQQLEAGSQARVVWSIWAFQDAQANAWTGSLYFFANPISATRYTAFLRADRQVE